MEHSIGDILDGKYAQGQNGNRILTLSYLFSDIVVVKTGYLA